MNITAEEKLMYEIMKAIYESGIPVSFKGSMVLKACLMEAGYNEETRHTVDIDANWNNNNRQLDTFDGFLHKTEDLRHSYEKFRFEGDVFKPPFDEVYLTVRKYIKEVLPRERHRVHER